MACVRIGIALAKEKENSEFIIFAVKTLTEAIEKTTDSGQLEALAGALKAVAEKVPPTEAPKIFAQLTAAIEKTTDPGQLGALAGALKAVPGKLDRRQLINLLKWPLSVGVLRSTLLDLLEQQTDKKFDGDRWKMVTWAQQNGLDVKSPPKRPDK